MSINKVILIGNLGRDPEIRSMGNGNEVASFSIATSETWKDKASGEKKEKTEWHNIVVFIPGLINVIRSYVKKGSKLYIEGKLQTRKWNDNTGVDRYRTEIVLQGYNAVLQILSSKGIQPEDPNKYLKPKDPDKVEEKIDFIDETADDDIPF